LASSDAGANDGGRIAGAPVFTVDCGDQTDDSSMMTGKVRPEALGPIMQAFDLPGSMEAAEPYGSGHINDTYRVRWSGPGRDERLYLLQRINHHVFKNPVAVMENIQRVTRHLAAKLADAPDLARRVLQLVPTRGGGGYHQDDAGNFWRVYHFVTQARTLDAVETPGQAWAAARAFGRFQQMLVDLPAPRLHDTIPDFHHTPKRFATFAGALAADAANRAAQAGPEIAFALQREPMTRTLLEAGLPERVTHNDTKLNNVLLDETTGEGICVVDLDTLMPGLAAYDFGDLVRTSTSPTVEDERDLSKVAMQWPLFEALVRGYLDSAGAFLTAAERRLLGVGGKIITFEIGLRFLTDFLAGDVYFKVHRPGQNLDRCRTQFKLVASIEEQENQMNRLLETYG
jgi:aminoglycoside phosphotransferase (APT) family kinase protein